MSPGEDFLDSGEQSSPLDLTRVLGFLSRYCWSIAGVTILALIPAIALPLFFADIYQATARVQMESRPEAMDTGTDYMPVGPGREVDPLTRELQIAMSDTVLGRVVDQFPSQPPKGPGILDRVLGAFSSSGQRAGLAPAQLRKARIEGLKRQIAIEQDPGAAFLHVSATAREPEAATFLANALADAIVDYKKDEQRGSYERTVTWLNTQVLELRERIGGNQENLRQHMSKHGIEAEPTGPDKKGGRSALLEELAQAEIEISAVRARRRELPAGVGSTSGDDYDPELLRVQQRYETARAALEEARLTYTPTHPEVQRREGVLKALERELESWGPMGAPVVGATPAEQQEYRQLVQMEAGLQARRGAIQRRLDGMSGGNSEKTRALGEYERIDRQLSLDREMLAMLMRKREEVVLMAAADYTTARVLDRAIPPVSPIGPDRLRLWLLGAGLALAAGIGLALARELLDQTVRDPEEAKRILDVPTVGMVPLIRDGTPPERQSEGSPGSLPAESYRNLRTALLFSSASHGFTTLVVTSGVAGEGKTTVSANLATSFSQSGRSVLLIDADMRVPRVHRIFSISSSPGLAELLRGEVELDGVVRRPNDGRFDVLTAGRQPPNPSELVASPEFALLLARVRTQYDLVIIDSPVLLGVADTQLLCSQADATLLVHRPGSLSRRGVREIRGRLDQAGARILGVVFNQVQREDRHFYPAYLESPYLTEDRGRRAVEG